MFDQVRWSNAGGQHAAERADTISPHVHEVSTEFNQMHHFSLCPQVKRRAQPNPKMMKLLCLADIPSGALVPSSGNQGEWILTTSLNL